ncbi:DMT family transporter [Paracoccus sulfuroxidans]|uniref:Putative membrane protein n=1 Tax=Paracoccus sulfuroxidans TaxID=384678 RepID=A0A562P178_9RHOB|nr:DMT family transporter [Paracoccus sulfuroxidans]TWI38083.1 putative membrane protein [Paracoccus sulfuroxidans]
MMHRVNRAIAHLGASGQPGSGRSTQTLGIMLLLLAIFLFTLMDATAKYLAQHYEPVQIVWARFAGNMLIVGVLFAPRFTSVLKSRQPSVQFGRALTQLASSALFFSSLAYIGLAEATAIMDINPVLITLGAAIFLGESIGIRRIIGIVVALIGAMIVIRPGAGVFHPAAVLPLIGAFTYAAGALLTRVARQDSTATSVLWSAMVGTIITSLAVPFFWQPIAPQHIWAFLLLGCLGAVSQALLIRAFSLAEAGAVAPFGYTGLIWAGLWGWLFWGNLPDKWTVIGAVIIVGAGIYVWAREARAMKQAE